MQAGTNQLYRPQPNHQQSQFNQPQQLQPSFHQLQQIQPQARPTQSQPNGRIDAQSIRTITSAAQRVGLTLPPGFDPNSLPREALASILMNIKTAEAEQRLRQMQQEQLHQTMGQQYPQQMRPGQGQYM